MKDLMEKAASQFGIDQDGAASAVGGMLGMLKEKADASDFQSLLSKVPGASDVLKAAPESGGGGGLLGSVGGLLGGKAGGALGIAALLQKSGLKTDQAGGFASMVVGYLKEKAGGDLVSKLLGKAPDLSKLLG